MTPDQKRRLELRTVSVDQLYESYFDKLKLEHGGRVLQEYLRVINLFREFLGTDLPSVEKARQYLGRFTSRSLNTRARYTDIVNGLLDWCGEAKVERVKVPKRCARYIPQSEFDTFFATISTKKTHKATIGRDRLMFDLQDATGMRCAEVADLKKYDLFLDGAHRSQPYLVAHGKGGKDRVIPLTLEMATRLRDFTKDKSSEESVFGLKVRSVVDKFYRWKRKASVSISAHDLRRRFATDLDSLGVNITTTQQLLGHEDVSTTQRYVAVPSEAARQAIELRTRRRGAAAGQEVDHHGDRLLTPDIGGGGGDPWVAALKVMLDPANLIAALNSENVEDVQLNVLPTTAVSRALQGASPEE